MKYFLISYSHNKGFGVTDYVTDDVYPNFRTIIEKLSVRDITIINIVEQTKEEHEMFWRKDGYYGSI